MRFQRFDLLRYGKFTDRILEFPRSASDFHLIVGANEAGKSTLRKAVGDLLYGFHPRTPLDFLHAKNELRVGALIENDEAKLEFIRLKGNKNTLRSPDGTPLPDHALDPFLGSATQAFFDKMFGLDQPRLVEGGNSILSAQDDVGQMLFQAAAGLASLGRVRLALQQEADALWAPTRSSKRAYYVARDKLDEASAALKATTVHTKQWAQLQERVATLEAELLALRDAQLHRHAEKNRLERIRRLRPFMLELLEAERELAALGEVRHLPADAAAVLHEAERAQALAQQMLHMRGREMHRLTGLHTQIQVDERLLSQGQAIESLDALRHQCSAQPAAILRCQAEVALLWREILRLSQELGWRAASQAGTDDPTEDTVNALRARLPGLPARKHLEQLLQEYAAAQQNLASTRAASSTRDTEAQALEAKLEASTVPQISPTLRALMQGLADLGDPEGVARKAQDALDAAEATLESALGRLGKWRQAPDSLGSHSYPSVQTVSAALTERLSLLAEARAADRMCTDQAAALARCEADVAQFSQRHHPITLEDVVEARGVRNASWGAIKAGDTSLADAAADYEDRVARADRLADERHDTASNEAELHGLQQRQRQEAQKLVESQQRARDCRRTLEVFDEHWQQRCHALDLDGMALDQLADWLVQKDKALDAALLRQRARQEQQALHLKQEQARGALEQALSALGHTPAVDGAQDAPRALAALRVQAQTIMAQADVAHARRETWLAQAAEAEPLRRAARQALEAAQARWEAWQEAWQSALQQAGLEPGLAPAAVQGALSVAAELAEKLEALRQLRHDRIAAMQAQLQDYIRQAHHVGVATGLLSQNAPALTVEAAFELAQDLARRLAAARQAQQEKQRLNEALLRETTEARAAEQAIAESQAVLRPLMEAGGASEVGELSTAIARSDRYRELSGKAAGILTQVLQSADGYGREQVQAEMDATDPSATLVQLDALQADIEAGEDQQSQLAVQLDQARRELHAIAGSDDAARAEAARQEALASMAEAAERYIKVRSAERLLRWAIDRYREEKQGPLLGRASTIFSDLTLGSFERLRVDYDAQPMVLEGQRPDGHCVGVTGLSDGTRDQLFLALRLAALELHADQGQVLPFIADDLFVNFDDARALAGLRALKALSGQMQVIFLSHHDRLTDLAQEVFGDTLNVVAL